ncbi:hypothetical protein CO610_07270 [Lysobacteraceae bacterium NML95-0200]|nr:hypothetical protein CO610_07270 [Xanthomonadaceae bacterium NML95-0200]
MSLLLFYDTETTGLYHDDLPPNDARQPRLVQLAAALVDANTRETVQEINLLIAPDDWEIPIQATAIHGITTEHAKQFGISTHQALQAFLSLWARADMRIAHNETFDAAIIHSALCSAEFDPRTLKAWQEGRALCTQNLTRGLQPEKPYGPSLAKAYQHYMGKPIENAHDARADMHACKSVYFHVIDNRPAAADRFKGERSPLPEIWQAALNFFDWETGDTRYVTTTSCLLFAERWAEKEAERARRLQEAIERTIEENLHLADGDACTLIHLVRALEHQ